VHCTATPQFVYDYESKLADTTDVPSQISFISLNVHWNTTLQFVYYYESKLADTTDFPVPLSPQDIMALQYALPGLVALCVFLSLLLGFFKHRCLQRTSTCCGSAAVGIGVVTLFFVRTTTQCDVISCCFFFFFFFWAARAKTKNKIFKIYKHN
jgi:hypothetical protein